jgi:hypothetical protein
MGQELEADIGHFYKTYQHQRKNRASERELEAIRSKATDVEEKLDAVETELRRRNSERRRQRSTEDDEFVVLDGPMNSRRLANSKTRRTGR